MQTPISSDKVEELIWHALTTNGVEDADFLIDWSWSSASFMKSRMGLLNLQRKPITIPVFEIFFSIFNFSFATEWQRENTVIHEACHVAECLRVGGVQHAQDPHGEEWKAAVLQTDYTPIAHTVLKMTDKERFDKANYLTSPDCVV